MLLSNMHLISLIALTAVIPPTVLSLPALTDSLIARDDGNQVTEPRFVVPNILQGRDNDEMRQAKPADGADDENTDLGLVPRAHWPPLAIHYTHTSLGPAARTPPPNLSKEWVPSEPGIPTDNRTDVVLSYRIDDSPSTGIYFTFYEEIRWNTKTMIRYLAQQTLYPPNEEGFESSDREPIVYVNPKDQEKLFREFWHANLQAYGNMRNPNRSVRARRWQRPPPPSGPSPTD